MDGMDLMRDGDLNHGRHGSSRKAWVDECDGFEIFPWKLDIPCHPQLFCNIFQYPTATKEYPISNKECPISKAGVTLTHELQVQTQHGVGKQPGIDDWQGMTSLAGVHPGEVRTIK